LATGYANTLALITALAGLTLFVGRTSNAVGYNEAITVNTILTRVAFAVRLARRRSLARIAMIVLRIVTEETSWTTLIVFAFDRAEPALFGWFFTNIGQAISACLTGLTNRQLAFSVDIQVAGIAITLFESSTTGQRKNADRNGYSPGPERLGMILLFFLRAVHVSTHRFSCLISSGPVSSLVSLLPASWILS
jgi:hypothetical protein